MNLVMYILVNKDLKGKMTAQKLAGQVAHAAGTYIYKHALEHKTVIYMDNNQTKIILECPETKLLEYEKDPTMITIRDAGHTELEPSTLTCICAGIFDKDENEVPKAIQKMQLLHWETVLNYDKYYTGKEILELIAKDKLPINHLIRTYHKDKTDNFGVCLIRQPNNMYTHIFLKERPERVEDDQIVLDLFTSDLAFAKLFKIDKEEWFKGE